MKRKIIFFAVAILVIVAVSFVIFFFSNNLSKNKRTFLNNVTGQTIPSPNKYYDVVRVIDGDTIVVNVEGKTETVRALGMNTPETVDPRKPVECFGPEASSEAKNLLENKKVRLETDPSQSIFDKYDRLLAYIYSSDGIFFDEYMIEKGFAFEYTYQGLAYKYQKDFIEKEASARALNLGLWAGNTCGGKLKRA